jgi:putative membrane protein
MRAGHLAGGGAALAVAWGPLAALAPGSLAGHMLQHLVVMNLAALLLAMAVRLPVDRGLALVAGLQVALLWGWHVPAVYAAAHHDRLLMASMQGSLLAVAFLFWSVLLARPVAAAWPSIFALLLTAKGFCLFGALLCFARRALYPAHGGDEQSALEDQQLAGLLMMASCALVYVATAMTLFVRWLDDAGRTASECETWRRVDA